MLNKEKYADEILGLAIYGKMFGVSSGKPKPCASMRNCNECEFKKVWDAERELKNG